MVALTLSYFPIRARAEPMRVLLADAGVEFVDKRIPLDEEWKTTLKAQYPFRQLPTLDVQDEQGNVFCLPETNAILQYLEDTFTVIPGHKERSALDQAQTTAVREAALMFIDHFWEFYWAENWTDVDALKRREARSHVWLEQMGAFLKTIKTANILADPAEGKGTTLTGAAAVLFEALELIENQFPGTVAKHAEVAAIHVKILSRPRVAQYLKDGKRAALITLSELETPEKRSAATEAWKAASKSA